MYGLVKVTFSSRNT